MTHKKKKTATMRQQIQRVNVDFTLPMLKTIDRECQRLNVSRQAWIKIQLANAIRFRGDLIVRNPETKQLATATITEKDVAS